MEVPVSNFRRTYGRDTSYFEETETAELEYVPSDPKFGEDFVQQNPRHIELDTAKELSLHSVNTEVIRCKTMTAGHLEGGWPKDVDPAEKTDVQRFRKKAEKDENFKTSVKAFQGPVEVTARMNNTIDIYEDYFDGAGADTSVQEAASCKTLAVFRDHDKQTRQTSSIDFNPEGAPRIAVTYAVLNFQDPRFVRDVSTMPKNSYIWDLTNPNSPHMTLTPPSPLLSLRYNKKNDWALVGGCYNGMIAYFDIRASSKPVSTSTVGQSHNDPVYDVFWTQSKSNSVCASVSTDGTMKFWDVRRLSEPSEVIQLNTNKGKENGVVLGGSSMEYNVEAGPTKYLVGTEQGVVMGINLRNKKQNGGVSVYDQMAGKHSGAIYSIQRNPVHNKFFMTVGDWTAKIWAEDVKTPMMSTKCSPSYLTSGCWSPTRPGVFFTTRADGVLDIWDYFYRQSEVAYSQKVGDKALTSIGTRHDGKMVAVGDCEGTVSLLEVCDSLAQTQPSEKTSMGYVFAREMAREKNLEQRAKELARKVASSKKAAEKGSQDVEKEKAAAMELTLKSVETDFVKHIAEYDTRGDVAAAEAAAAAAAAAK